MTLDESPAWSGPTGDAPTTPASTVRSRVLFVLLCAAAGAVLAVPAGWLWSVVADAPQGVVFGGQVYYDEVQLNVQSGMTMWFLVIGAAFGLLTGLAAGLRGHRHGVVTVVAVLVACGVGSVLSAYLGIHVFGPDEQAQVADAADGDTVQGGLEVATWVAYLGWPVGGLVGALAAIAGWPRESAGSS